jgi:hypothetical protein
MQAEILINTNFLFIHAAAEIGMRKSFQNVFICGIISIVCKAIKSVLNLRYFNLILNYAVPRINNYLLIHYTVHRIHIKTTKLKQKFLHKYVGSYVPKNVTTV